ncbi:DUF3817 domain-containing protein [Achromobacter kerstersii]|uniref:DUF3817 domain-containing protein n=1 Tax=Achromobacter kerstersii TaxID=1353890 RepID=UPI00158208B9|nr:DUF3817 domain-containing protein [Achromobacter kerstersii]
MNSRTQDAQRATSRSRITQLRLFCLAETATLLALLFVAVPLKHLAGYPFGVSVLGPIHGFVFLAFGWSVAQSIGEGTIHWRTGGKLMLAACLPFGGIYSWWSLR